MQNVTSKNTSVNKLAGFYKKAVKAEIIGNGEVVLDYGCGKNFDPFTLDFADKNNFAVMGYDKYHMLPKVNSLALSDINMKHVDLITCNNILNVLDNESLNAVIDELRSLSVLYKIPIYITVYEGDKTGHGKETRNDCYQRNETRLLYAFKLQRYFKNVVIVNGIIKAE